MREPFAGLAAEDPGLDLPNATAWWIAQMRVHLERRAAVAQAALSTAEILGAHGYAATALSVLAVIELRRGDLAAAAQHLACRPATSPQFADLYARPETTVAEAQITEARDGPAAALGHLRQLCELAASPGVRIVKTANSACPAGRRKLLFGVG